MTTTPGKKMTMHMRWAIAGVLRPQSGAPMALGATSEAKTAAAINGLLVPRSSATTEASEGLVEAAERARAKRPRSRRRYQS